MAKEPFSRENLRIAAYCRVSTEKEEQLDSLRHQKEFFSEYAAKNGYDLIELYADEGISGTSLKKREAFKRLLRDAETGRFDLVVVKDVSRFARNTVDFLQSIRSLKALGINTRFLTANMESLGESEFVLTVFSALAQEESVNLSKRVKFGKKLNAEKGRVPPRIFGYRRIDNFTLEIDEAEAEVIRTIYHLYLEDGLGCRRISQWLNDSGCYTRQDCLWNPQGVRRILKNPIYCGHYVNNKYEIADVLEGRQVRLPPEENFHHRRPEWAIIPEDRFQAAQTIMAQRGRSRSPTVRFSSRHVFSGLIDCGECGSTFHRMHYHNSPTAKPYWRCSSPFPCRNHTRVREEALLTCIREHLLSAVGGPDRLIRALMENPEKKNREYDRAGNAEDDARRAQRLHRKRARYQELYTDGLLSRDELDFRLSEIDRAERSLHVKASLRAAGEDSVQMQCSRMTEDFFRMDRLTNTEMRRIIDRITVYEDGRVKLVFRSPGTSPLL